MEETRKSMEQALRERGRIVITAEGASMLPCIRPKKDALILEVPKKKIARYDILLYKRDNGVLVLHRVLQIKNDSYGLCGDHQYEVETGVQESQILAVLKGFYRGDTYVDCETNRWYRLYVRLWCVSLTLRKCLIRGKNGWKRCKKKKAGERI